jgi:hypothetical protein
MISLRNITPLDIAELLGLFAFLLSMFAPAILTKIYFKSFRKGVMVFLLNYALAFVRAKAALSAIFGRGGKLDWKGPGKGNKNSSILSVIDKTKVEVGFVVILVALGIVALMRANISGGVWLLWYGGMYSLTPLFFFKYG